MLVRDSKRQAGERAMPVDVNRTGAALALIATFLAAAERELFPEGIEQGGSRIELKVSLFAVDAERYGNSGAGLVGRGSLAHAPSIENRADW